MDLLADCVFLSASASGCVKMWDVRWAGVWEDRGGRSIGLGVCDDVGCEVGRLGAVGGGV